MQPENLHFLCYAHITPIFGGQTDPAQWDHKSPKSWGNSGNLRFSGMWPFGHSAGCFMAPNAQNGPFCAQNWCFCPEIIFLWTPSNFFVTIITKHQKDNVFVLEIHLCIFIKVHNRIQTQIPIFAVSSENPKKNRVIENERVCQADIDVLRLDDSACNRN